MLTGGAAVNKELRREVREISPRRPFLPTTDGGGGVHPTASPALVVTVGGGAVQLVVLFGREAM